ncbi:MAG TPA: FAD-dependent oxidoreductase, partial [Pyrinomonadaceae bacterium]|nr:FAD-dependent oxidoreductase [Pyrinomonadaceae bacterium]
TNREVNRLIGGTKGSHIIVAPFDGASTTAVYVEAKSDQRPFFIIPWDNKYLIGTTDIRYDGDLDNLQITDEEIHYLLRETNRIIPTANLNRDKILYSYSGVRPLPFTDDEDERSITRRHFIRRHSGFGNLLSIVGGKLTTYRSLSEEAVDLVFKILGRNSPPCITAGTPLPGASSETSNASNPRASQPVTDRLKRIYGTRASEVIKLIEKDESLSSAFDSETGAIAAEVVYAFTNEFASTLPDCLLRRTMVGLNSNCGLNAIERAGQIAQQHLDWSESRVTEELSDYQRYVERFILR